VLSYNGRDGLEITSHLRRTSSPGAISWPPGPAALLIRCFTLQAPGTLGNAGRNIGTSPGYAALDFNVSKDTKITEESLR